MSVHFSGCIERDAAVLLLYFDFLFHNYNHNFISVVVNVLIAGASDYNFAFYTFYIS